MGEHGYIGSEAHANGRKASHSVNLGTKPVSADSETVEDAPPVIPTAGPTTYVQKVKPPKKYSLIAQNVSETYYDVKCRPVEVPLGVTR